MIEEKIFGPLTLRQFIYTAIGFGISYLSHSNLEKSISIPIIIVVIILTINFVFNTSEESEVFSTENLSRKRTELGEEKFDKWTQRKIAEIQSQISTRENRGLVADPNLNKIKEILESAMRK